MTVKEFITTFAFAALSKGEPLYKLSLESMSEEYKNKMFYIPKICCKDGFDISIQIHWGAYCESENGTREYGIDWKKVEWGYPSEPIDGKKYNAEDPDDTTDTVGGYVDIMLMEELINEHGGIDLQKTLTL
jgi:hypothetical protein